MATILDISPLLSSRLAVWPGDHGFVRKSAISAFDSGPVEVGNIFTTLHAGAHADAPSHYLPGGPAIDAVDLGAYLGPCEVIQVDLEPGSRILPEHLPGPIRAPRVLFRTSSYADPETFTRDFCALSVPLIEHLKAQGALLAGIDTPSVDPFSSRGLEAHHALAAADMRVLEGLRLAGAEPGLYTLVALPLRIEDGDGSPVRAVLVRGAL